MNTPRIKLYRNKFDIDFGGDKKKKYIFLQPNFMQLQDFVIATCEKNWRPM